MGIEPTHKGFADLSLTAWVPRLMEASETALFQVPTMQAKGWKVEKPTHSLFMRHIKQKLERETGFEPATSTLARSHSTTELLPLGTCIITIAENEGQTLI